MLLITRINILYLSDELQSPWKQWYRHYIAYSQYSDYQSLIIKKKDNNPILHVLRSCRQKKREIRLKRKILHNCNDDLILLFN